MARNLQPRTPPGIKLKAKEAEPRFPVAPSPAATLPAVKTASKTAVKPATKPASSSRIAGLPLPVTNSTTAGATRILLPSKYAPSKKQKVDLDKWRGENACQSRSVVIAEQIAGARKKFGNSAVMVGSDADALIVTIPIPALSFEFLIQQNGWPLGLFFQLVGTEGSFKSGLLAEIIRWHELSQGYGILQENETKFSPDWYSSIIGYKSLADCALILNRCNSVEDWQDRMTYFINESKKMMEGTKDKPGPGRVFPICFGVDTISGKVSEATMKKFLEEGHYDRRFPVETLLITSYMQSLPQLIDNWPFSFVMVNHLKKGKDNNGIDVRNKPGGKGVGFQQSFELEMQRIAHKSFAAYDVGVVRIKMYKNSFGYPNREIVTRILWWEEDDPVTGRPFQRTVWDWDWSLINLLSTIEGRTKTRLKDAGIHIATPLTGQDTCTAWSESLGMKASDALPWSEVGAMFRRDPVLVAKIRDAFFVKHRNYLEGDFLKQLDNLAGASA